MSFIYAAKTHLLYTPSARGFSSHMEPCILKKEYSQGVNMKMMPLNLVLFIYIMFSTTVTSDPYALWAAFQNVLK